MLSQNHSFNMSKEQNKEQRALDFAEAIQDHLWWDGPDTQHDSDTLAGVANLAIRFGFGPKLASLVQRLKERYTMFDLSDHVDTLKMCEAKSINTSSIEKQIQYLVEQAGIDWVEEVLLSEDESE